MHRLWILGWALMLLLLPGAAVGAQSALPVPYDLGSPALTTIYVSTSGSDANDGAAPERALRTLSAAWERIPQGVALSGAGYRIALLPGVYTAADAPNYWESRYGSAEAPILIVAEQGRETVFLPSINLFDSRHIAFIDLVIDVGADAFHCERCDHLLIRGSRLAGAAPESYAAQETLKVNQSQYIYIEDSDISGAWDNAVDFVAVQYGHILGSRIHNAGDWCLYLKGGSAYFTVAQNEIYDCGTGGVTAGQGTGLQFMTPPWLQYEAYDIRVLNNTIRDTQGAGLGVQGGTHILMAHNLLTRVGQRSHLIEVGFGGRSCDGQPGDAGRERCESFVAQGGWGDTQVPDGMNYVRIPNHDIAIIGNVIYNPPGYRSGWQHFALPGPYSAPNGSVPVPALADDGLVIAGNWIWNGDASMPLGIEANPDAPTGCADAHPTCSAAQLIARNSINSGSAAAAPALDAPLPVFAWDAPVPAPQHNDFTGVPLSPAEIAAFAGQQAAAAPPAAPPPTTSASLPPPQAVAALPLPPGPLVIVTLGDSLTAGDRDERELGGYPGRLLSLLSATRPGSSLLNLGRSGWNSDALIAGDQGLPGQLPQALQAISEAQQPALALVWIGSNDLFYLYEYGDPDAVREAEDVAHFADNLDHILSALTGAGARVVVALLDDQALRPVVLRGEAFTGITPAEAAQMSAQVRRYNAVIVEAAARYGALTVDFFTSTLFVSPETLADDGNHPSAAGYDAAAALWFSAIQPLLSAP